MREHARTFAATILCINFLIYLFPLQSSVFVVHFSNAGSKAFPKGSYWTHVVRAALVAHSCCSLCLYRARIARVALTYWKFTNFFLWNQHLILSVRMCIYQWYIFLFLSFSLIRVTYLWLVLSGH